MKEFGINIHYLGGETADVGDVVRTIAVNGTMTARWPANRIVTNERIKAGDVIVGLAGFGQSTYETEYNSGIGSNGLTSARHDILNSFYRENYKESFDNSLADDITYIGIHKLTDPSLQGVNIGKLLLSPTRTFAPVLKYLLEDHFENIHGLIHCSGGGQTKCLKYLPGDLKIIKDNLFAPPLIFQLIQEASGSEEKEMYQVFNMGTRMEIYTDEDFASTVIKTAEKFKIDAQVIGRVEAGTRKELIIKTTSGNIFF
jgi:phosphoribosylformylglycinamidine cyclo-ligase